MEEPEVKPKHAGGRPLLFSDANALEKALTQAIAEIKEENLPLIVENIAVKLSCSASTLRKYGARAEDDPQFLKPIKTMLDECQAWQVSKLYTAGQAAGPIFALKNNYPDEYRDKTEVAAEHTSPDGSMTPGQVDPSIAAGFAQYLKGETKENSSAA